MPARSVARRRSATGRRVTASHFRRSLNGVQMSDSSSPPKIDRRSFLGQSARVAAGAAIGTSALSYSRIVGANDRISLGHIGIGNRGRELDAIAGQLKDKYNVEMTAVCDLWTVNREKAV